MQTQLSPLPLDRIRLGPGLFRDRFELNRRYLMSLETEHLLRSHYLEARLWHGAFHASGPGPWPSAASEGHWGWDSPTSQIRGHFLGHWLWAAARTWLLTEEAEIKVRADRVVAELARCQEANGGEWVGSIPESYLEWTAKGSHTWAPQYVIHKTLMGLLEMHSLTGSEQALEIVERCARWFHRWTARFPREQMDDLLDVETGGMIELWADLYGLTGKQEHLDLITRYDRPRLFDRLLAGEDPLTNQHANTTIPEAHGAARAWEVTGDERWRRVAEAYWRCAVTDRGYYCTGGQTCGEVWTPPFEQAARLGDRNQEHCTVYNMMRLADYLLRWSGDACYADYIERNLYNGILAQQHSQTGMVAYFLPLRAGARRVWGHPTRDFWCCHSTLVQAHTLYPGQVYYEDAGGLVVCQYLPSEAQWNHRGTPVLVRQSFDAQGESEQRRRPSRWVVELVVKTERPVTFTLSLRVPEWTSGPAAATVNGSPVEMGAGPSSFLAITREWHEDRVRLELPKPLRACPLPDEPGTVAFLDGPVVLAGLCEEERELVGDTDDPRSLLAPDNEREWSAWLGGYRAVGQHRGLRFRPLYEVGDEAYTVYFPVRRRG